ncbi:MAG: aminotransferase class V-fold PLP-dependent enzyme [Clostridia bacterium]|nr:aminotransferase class V-fold PLP-dependent enzyme [Clostridia bacterium]
MIYFDNAATTFPKPGAVVREMVRCMREWGGNPGRSGHALSLAASEAIYSVREELASFFGLTRAENIVFTQNCTHALNLVISGIGRYGDHLLISNLEHNSVLRTVDQLCRLRGMSYDVFNGLGSDAELLAEIESKCKPRTRAVITVHASNVCPRRLPIGDIGALCRARGILCIVDAAQSAGIYDISIPRDGISALCAPGHKGLYGPQGSGFAAFADDFDFEMLLPSLYGGNGRSSAERGMGTVAPESYEAGTVATPAIVGLGAGVRFVRRLGTGRIAESEHQLFRYASRLICGIPRAFLYLPEAREGSLLLLGFDGIAPSAVADRLAALGVCVRAGMHCAPTAHEALGTGGDALRVSFSAMNTLDEVTRFAHMLESVVGVMK